MKSRKSFTMVELLATVTILGILMVVSIGSITMLMKKGKTNYYSTQRKNLISTAKSYYNDNKQMLPKMSEVKNK